MKNLYVVAHTQSIHHVEGKVGGWFDTSLTELGRAQAVAVAGRLAELLESATPAITSSDLRRARETAEIVAERFKCPLELTPDLRELSYGSAEGRPQRWLDDRFQPAPNWIGMPLQSAGFVNFRSRSGGITHLQEDHFLRNRTVRFLNSTSHLD